MISFRSLPLRNARFHWRGNLPVALGVAVATAVLAGALIVGDSLRGSLKDRGLKQLNGVEAAYVGPTLIREDIAKSLPNEPTPALILQGSVQFETASGATNRIARVTVIGLPERGRTEFGLPGDPANWGESNAVAILSPRIAERLGVKTGDKIDLGLERFSNVRRSSVLGKRNADDVTATIRVEVRDVLSADHAANDFNLTPSPSTPLNLYVPLAFLQQSLKLQTPVDAQFVEPLGAIAGAAATQKQWGRVNALLARSGTIADLNEALANNLDLHDYGLRAEVAPARKAYVSVESEKLVLDSPTALAVENAAKKLNARSEPTMAYLANAIVAGPEPVWNNDAGKSKKLIPYSIVAGLDPTAKEPLGPFLPPGVASLADDEIVLVDWAESPLKDLQPGDTVTITYFKPEMEATVEEASFTFKFKGFVPFRDPDFPTAPSRPPVPRITQDPNLTPPFPGITDALTLDKWVTPFDGFINKQRIRTGDINEQFWKKHKTTPKAYITKAKAAELFGSRFGSVTSVRVAPIPGKTSADTAKELRTEIRTQLKDSPSAVRFESTRDRVIEASVGGTDFAALLLLFSWLLIGAALLLVGILFRLTMERRAKEIGLLLASGYTPSQVRNLLIQEGLFVAGVGAIFGLVGAIAYAKFMIDALVSFWPDKQLATYLNLHVQPLSLMIGFVATLLVALGTIWLSVRGLVKVSPPALLRGVTTTPEQSAAPLRWPWWSLGGAILAGILGLGVLFSGFGQANPDERSGAFFSGGGLILAAGLLLARVELRRPRRGTIRSHGVLGIISLGRRNIGKNPGRSLLTAALIAFATFLIVSVESFRRTTGSDFLEPSGGSGGFRLVAESEVPVFQKFDHPPNTPQPAGREDIRQRLQKIYQAAEARNPSVNREELLLKADASLDTARVYYFHLKGGDDASCLNLYQAGQPRVLGVPDDLIDRGGFRFAESEATTDDQKKNPWLLLKSDPPPLKADLKLEDESIIRAGTIPIPAFAEQNSAMFMLKTPLGGIYVIRDEAGRPVPVRIVGLLQDSVFQSELLIADAKFRTLYPQQEGYRVFLIDVPATHEDEVANLLELGLRPNGFTVTKSTDRVGQYQEVVGAYLTTFQLLGGFALLLAVLGAGVIVLRSVWERVGELALLRAVGYRTTDLQLLIVTETVLVLAMGLAIGTVAAAAAVAPNVALGGSIPWGHLAMLLGAVIATGVIVALVATAGVARAPLIPSLRKE